MNRLKNKKSVTILLPIVILIWGWLFFQLYRSFRSTPKNEVFIQEVAFKPPTPKAKEAFAMLPIDSDPFLGTAYKPQQTIAKPSSKNAKKKELPWPNIQYLGLVSNTNQKSKVYIVNLNGKQILLSLGETVEGITLLKGDGEKATFRFEGTTKEIPLL